MSRDVQQAKLAAGAVPDGPAFLPLDQWVHLGAKRLSPDGVSRALARFANYAGLTGPGSPATPPGARWSPRRHGWLLARSRRRYRQSPAAPSIRQVTGWAPGQAGTRMCPASAPRPHCTAHPSRLYGRRFVPATSSAASSSRKNASSSGGEGSCAKRL